MESSNVYKLNGPGRTRARPSSLTVISAAVACALAAPAWAGGEQVLEKVTITGSATGSVGVADSASVGTVTQKQLEARTVYRPGELLEATPGLVVSQHSGEGKANQFYLRGFNLDHGTDLRTTVDGMLVNQRSHSHGQGWTDLNFLIPELATGLRYKKGPYDASEGDFASAGTVAVIYADELPTGLASIGLGQNGFRRVLLADSPDFASGKLLYAIEGLHNDGPFVNPDDYRKLNGVLRYSVPRDDGAFSITAMGYRNRWNSTDQVADRAISSGYVSRYGAIDPTDGGETHRYSLSADWEQRGADSVTRATGYGVDYRLKLASNFTYFLDDPVNGDQFQQRDRRVVTGLKANHQWLASFFGMEAENTVGIQLRNDNIVEDGLFHTKARGVLDTVRVDHVTQSSGSLYAQTSLRLGPKVRTILGLRGDLYRFHVASDNPGNSGDSTASLASPKVSLILGPWANTEFYANFGYGFHSNDARGSTITQDPKTGEPVDRVTPLVRAKGAEVGIRSVLVPHLQSTLSLWGLEIGSELVFTGDAGTTEASRPSRRSGLEWANYYSPTRSGRTGRSSK